MPATRTNDTSVDQALDMAVQRLAGAWRAEGYWEGRLSSSALSTATALSALALAEDAADVALLAGGMAWLGRTQNPDGGWGDTEDSPSNLSTTLLAVSALQLASGRAPAAAPVEAVSRAQAYVGARAGATAGELAAAIQGVYGADRTFAVPILMNCALAGMVEWDAVPALPFELALAPAALYRALRLHVVSYALPALIAVGLLLHRRSPARSRGARLARQAAEGPALARLVRLQPEHGGFLDATPLTSFVCMSLLAAGHGDHVVARKCLGFVRQSAREDGSWPIDTNLSVWVTTGALTALRQAGDLGRIDAVRTYEWVARRQYAAVHPFTNAAPGGWGWTHLPGGVPDADDTAGAMVALAAAGAPRETLAAGAQWLLGLQNADGGWPTFCRGWGRLPFDRSSPDVTAHALRALASAGDNGPKTRRAIERGQRYLRSAQRGDGSWTPLWFGSQQTVDGANPVLGTARVLLASAELGHNDEESRAGLAYLLAAQHPGGGWGAAPDMEPTIEETALSVSALTEWNNHPGAMAAAARGAGWLAGRVRDGGLERPSPLGLYFASLWYSEELYPVIWTVEALGRFRARMRTS